MNIHGFWYQDQTWSEFLSIIQWDGYSPYIICTLISFEQYMILEKYSIKALYHALINQFLKYIYFYVLILLGTVNNPEHYSL